MRAMPRPGDRVRHQTGIIGRVRARPTNAEAPWWEEQRRRGPDGPISVAFLVVVESGEAAGTEQWWPRTWFSILEPAQPGQLPLPMERAHHG